MWKQQLMRWAGRGAVKRRKAKRGSEKRGKGRGGSVKSGKRRENKKIRRGVRRGKKSLLGKALWSGRCKVRAFADKKVRKLTAYSGCSIHDFGGERADLKGPITQEGDGTGGFNENRM